LQGLWAGPWLADVEGLPRQDVVMHLLWMAIALSVSALILGMTGDRLRRRGVSLSSTFAIATSLAMLAQIALVLRWPVPAWLPWIAIAGIGAGTVLSYAIVSQLFPKSASGRASGALNLLHIGAAFVVQLGTGFVLDLWPVEAGRHPAVAYQNALGINLTLQAAAFLWFVRPERRVMVVRLSAHPVHGIATALGITPSAAAPYLHARLAWRAECARALLQSCAWRATALTAIGTTLAIVTAFETIVIERSSSGPQNAVDIKSLRQISSTQGRPFTPGHLGTLREPTKEHPSIQLAP
jgi:MFS family permease